VTEKTEWELVDADAPSSSNRSGAYDAYGNAYDGKAPQSPMHLLKAVLGPYWRWKIAGLAIVASLALILLATVAGVFMVTMSAVVIMAVIIRKLKYWLSLQTGRDGRA
jgi:hypothetical protein